MAEKTSNPLGTDAPARWGADLAAWLGLIDKK
jgi:hypothetical protein